MTFQPEIEFFLSKFAHEIRNPLTTLYSTVQLIEAQHPEVSDFRHWSSLSDDIEYMNQLLDELSGFAKSERITPESFDFRFLLEKVALSFAASIADSQVEFTSKIDPRITYFTGDRIKLEEVLRNLLKNAYEASLPDATVSLEATLGEDAILLTIRDTGCGMSEEQRSMVFEPFVTYKKGGSGLGLPICQHVVTAHGGTIEVSSALGKGTTFCVTLPYSFAQP